MVVTTKCDYSSIWGGTISFVPNYWDFILWAQSMNTNGGRYSPLVTSRTDQIPPWQAWHPNSFSSSTRNVAQIGELAHNPHTNIPSSPWLPVSSNLTCHVSSKGNIYLPLEHWGTLTLPLNCFPLFITTPCQNSTIPLMSREHAGLC